MLHFFNVPGTRKIREKNLFFENARFWYKKVEEVFLRGTNFVWTLEVGSILTVEAGPSILNQKLGSIFLTLPLK